MVQCFDYMKHQVVNFKVDMCCWVAPVRIGLLTIAYINVLSQIVSLIGLSDDTYGSLLMAVEEAILEDNAKKSIPVLAYAVDLSFTVILLCAIYRKDIPLLRLYYRYCIGTAIISVLVYSMIVAALSVLMSTVLVVDIVFQIYVLVLVRSMIVEMKLEKQTLPTVVMSSLISEPKEVKIEPEPDVESSSDSDESDSKHENDDQKERLETVDEHPKEESTAEEGKDK